MKYLIAVVSAALCLLVSAGTTPAQHHHGGHHVARVPVHHGVNYGHQNWHHVVPHHPTYAGAYYTTGSTHYYTPAPVVSVIPLAGIPAAPTPAPIEVRAPVELTFGGYKRYEDLAGRLTFEANNLCLEMHYNYRGNKNFAEVYREAYDILQAAKYLHAKEHNGDRDLINKRMVEVDKLFHHVQDEMRDWTRSATRQVGVNALPEKIEGIEAVIHHLSFDVGVRPHEQPAAAAPPPVMPDEVAPPPPPVIKM